MSNNKAIVANKLDSDIQVLLQDIALSCRRRLSFFEKSKVTYFATELSVLRSETETIHQLEFCLLDTIMHRLSN